MTDVSLLERVNNLIDWLIFEKIIRNRRDLADKIGYTESSLSQITNGKVELSFRFIKNLAKIDSRINIEWIETGKGLMLFTKESKVSFDISKNIGIPLIPAHAIAGAFSGGLDVLEYECERFVIPAFKGADFLISVKGSSMEPKYSSGDIVACKKLPLDTFFQWNKVYIIDTDQGPLIKKVKKCSESDRVLIVSENPEFEPFELSKSAIYHIALVLGVIRLE